MKIFIFGAPWSGKTTILHEIRKSSGIPTYELDDVFFREGAVRVENVKKRGEVVAGILKTNAWCIEWMYRQNWLDDIIQEADHIFVMNVPVMTRHYRILSRTLRRMMGLESHPRKSSWWIIFNLLYFNQFVYKKAHLQDFLKRCDRTGKDVTLVSSGAEIVQLLQLNR